MSSMLEAVLTRPTTRSLEMSEGRKPVELRVSNNKAFVWDLDGKYRIQKTPEHSVTKDFR